VKRKKKTKKASPRDSSPRPLLKPLASRREAKLGKEGIVIRSPTRGEGHGDRIKRSYVGHARPEKQGGALQGTDDSSMV